jgi:hypothetical protein
MGCDLDKMVQRLLKVGPVLFLVFYFEGTVGVTICFTSAKRSICPPYSVFGDFFAFPLGDALISLSMPPVISFWDFLCVLLEML